MIIIFAIVFAVWGFFIFCFILNAANPTPTWKQGKEGYKDLKEKNSILQQKAKQLDIEEKEIDNLRSEILVLENTKKMLESKKKEILTVCAKSLKVLRLLSLLDYVGARDAKEISNSLKIMNK